MAPSKFQIYIDQSMRSAPAPQPASTAPAAPASADCQSPFDLDGRGIHVNCTGEYSFEELRYFSLLRKQKEKHLQRICEELARENEDLRQKLEAASKQTQSGNRLSIVPQSLQPAQDCAEMSCYETLNEGASVIQDCFKTTMGYDKFTVPIDQSQYIRENVPTSTPNSKDDRKRPMMNRRMSRPSMAGSPTLKLSPITETSRDCNSKSSSSSSASTTPKPLVHELTVIDDRPLDPNDPTTYCKLLRLLAEPIQRRAGYVRAKGQLPSLKNCTTFEAGTVEYLVDKELSKEPRIFTAQDLTDSDLSSSDVRIKSVCFRVDQPANEWLFYICNELHRRCQKMKPDIELSVMISDPAIMYDDGSILIDEYFRFVTLDDYFVACSQTNKAFPKSVGAYITLELLQLVKTIHNSDIIHMNINAKNIIVLSILGREDIESVDVRTSLIKLLGFDRAVDCRLLPAEFKFETTCDHLKTCEMLDSKPWTYEIDWFGVLSCIHSMFFQKPLTPIKEEGRWKIERRFDGFPTNVWNSLFDELLNIDDLQAASKVVDQAIDELRTWIKANINFVLREALNLEFVLEDYQQAAGRSVKA